MASVDEIELEQLIVDKVVGYIHWEVELADLEFDLGADSTLQLVAEAKLRGQSLTFLLNLNYYFQHI